MYKLIALICLLQFSNTMCQTQKSDLIIINDDGTTSNIEPVGTKLIIKTNMFEFIGGSQRLELEYRLNDFIALQGGAGITFPSASKDLDAMKMTGFIHYFQNGDNCESDNFNAEEDICDSYDNATYRKVNLGYQAIFMSKFYLDNSALEDSYIGLGFRFKGLNFEAEKAYYDASNDITRDPKDLQKERSNNLEIFSRYGYQWLYKKLSLDWYIGTGVKLSNRKYQDLGKIDNEIVNDYRDWKARTLVFHMGLSLGIQLNTK